jgi:hypothetical protein
MVERGLRVAAIPGGEAVLRAEPRAGRRCWWTWGGAGRPAVAARRWRRTISRRAVELVPGGGGEAGSRTAVARQAEGKAGGGDGAEGRVARRWTEGRVPGAAEAVPRGAERGARPARASGTYGGRIETMAIRQFDL